MSEQKMRLVEAESDGEGEGYKLGVFGLLSVGFFWVIGGIYGNEALVQAAPPGVMFLFCMITPLLYSLPIALMTAELATAIPSDGGSVVWVNSAFGTTVGGHNGYWVWINWLFDSAIYPVLLSQYIVTLLGRDIPGIEGLVAMGVVVFVTCIKLMGMQFLVRFSSALAIFSMLPAILFVILGVGRLDFDVLTSMEGEIDWALLSSWCIWLYCGFLGLGSLAGEVDRPKRTFPVTIGVLMPLTILTVVLPLAVCLSIDPDRENYVVGHFSVLAEEISGPWLKYFFFVGSCVSLIGLYNAQVMTAERSLMVLVQWHFRDWYEAHKHRSKMWTWLLSEDTNGCGALFILINAAVALVVIWAPYDILVEFSTMLMGITTVLFFFAFVWLRYKQPGLERPYRVPGNLLVAVLVMAVPLAITLLNMGVVLIEDEPVMGIPYVHLVSLAIVVLLGCVIHVLWTLKTARNKGHALLSTEEREDVI